jgi:hypothetical protein
MTTPEIAALLGEPYWRIRWLITTRQVPLPRRVGMSFDWTPRDVERLRRVLAGQRRRREDAAAKRQGRGRQQRAEAEAAV